MAKNFQDITNKAYVALAAGYGIEGAFPIDLRTVLPGTTMLEALIHNNMMYEGLRVYIAGTVYICKPKFHSAVWNPDGDIAASKSKYYLDEELTQPITDGTASGTTVYSNMLWYEVFQVESSSVQTATQADKLSHNVVINGKATNFAVPTGEDVTTIDTGLFTPETIEADTNIDAITHCGFYSYTDANESANNYSLLIEKIGNKLYRTKITIENGVPVVSTSVQIGTQGDTVIWGEWMRLGIGKCITTCTSQSLHTSSVGGNHVALDINIGSTPELWVYSDSTATYPQGYANIYTADGQVFPIAAQPTAIAHPFVVKLKTANDGTRTATVESLKADADNFGQVKLSDATNSESGANGGFAATPNAVATVDARLTAHADTKANGSTFGHVKVNAGHGLTSNDATIEMNPATAENEGTVKLSDSTDDNRSANDSVAASAKAIKTLADMWRIEFQGLSYYCVISGDDVRSYYHTDADRDFDRWVGEQPEELLTGDYLHIQIPFQIQIEPAGGSLIPTCGLYFTIPNPIKNVYTVLDMQQLLNDGVATQPSQYITLAPNTVLTFQLTSHKGSHGSADYYKLNYISPFNVNEATESQKGLVYLTDTIGDGSKDVNTAFAVTPKAVADYVQAAIQAALNQQNP